MSTQKKQKIKQYEQKYQKHYYKEEEKLKTEIRNNSQYIYVLTTAYLFYIFNYTSLQIFRKSKSIF